MIGNEEDFSAGLGFVVKGMDEHLSKVETDAFREMIRTVLREFSFKVVATTLRKAKTATLNDWGAICYSEGSFFEAKHRPDLEILDRVGSGDSFASALIYALLTAHAAQSPLH